MNCCLKGLTGNFNLNQLLNPNCYTMKPRLKKAIWHNGSDKVDDIILRRIFDYEGRLLSAKSLPSCWLPDFSGHVLSNLS